MSQAHTAHRSDMVDRRSSLPKKKVSELLLESQLYAIGCFFPQDLVTTCSINQEVPWYSGVTARLSRWESGFDTRCRPVLSSFSKTLYPHCCSRPRCINGDPAGCERYCGWIGMCAPVKWRPAGMLLREWKLCTVFSAELKFNPMTGVIIICARCDIVVLWIAFLNACYYYYYLTLAFQYLESTLHTLVVEYM